MENLIFLIVVIAVILFFGGIRIVRPTTRGLIERLGKYQRFAKPGFHWIIPINAPNFKSSKLQTAVW